MNKYDPCACWSKIPYSKCCKSYHDGTPAPTALALMRSRYAAYAIGLSDYIIATTHSSNPEYQTDVKKWTRELDLFHEHTRFLGLTINHSEQAADTATVTFTAYLMHGEIDGSFTEQSNFVREDGRWLYQNGSQDDSN